jgi:hypothetical protein
MLYLLILAHGKEIKSENQIQMKKRYLIFAILYTFLNIYLWHTSKDESFLFVMPSLWIFGVIALVLLLFFDKKKFNWKDFIAIGFCTPIPLWIITFIIDIPSNIEDLKVDINGKTQYYEDSSVKRKEVTYRYPEDDGLKEVQQFKLDANKKWVRDGQWLYFDLKGDIKEEVYSNDTLIKSIISPK